MQLSYNDETVCLSATQVMGALLTKCKQVVQFNNPTATSVDMVISVPPYFTDAQRRAVQDAAKIAQVNCLRLLNEGTAAALSYGIFKGAKKEFPEEKQTLCLFLDMGHASFTATVAKFTNASLEVVASVTDSELGSRNLDVAIAKYFADEFTAKHKIDAWKSKKARVKLMVAAEKAKVSISPHGVNSTPVSVECLLEDRDFNGVLTAEKLDELMGVVVSERVGSVIKRALVQSNARDAADFAAIELVGGGMRPRLVKRAAAVALGLPLDEANSHGLSMSMNLDEAVARGCALCCASLSPVFKVKPFAITDVVSYPVQLSWDAAAGGAGAGAGAGADDDDDAASGTKVVVFALGSQVKSKVVTLPLTSGPRAPFTVCVDYVPGPEHENMFPAGATTVLGRYLVSGMPDLAADDVSKVRLTVKVSFDGNVEVSSAEIMRAIKDEAAPAADASASSASASASASSSSAAAAADAAPSLDGDAAATSGPRTSASTTRRRR